MRFPKKYKAPRLETLAAKSLVAWGATCTDGWLAAGSCQAQGGVAAGTCGPQGAAAVSSCSAGPSAGS